MSWILVLALVAGPTDVVNSVEKDISQLQHVDGTRYLSLHDIENKEDIAKIVSFTLNSISNKRAITIPKLSDDKLFIRFNLYDYGITKAGYDALGKNKAYKSDKLNKIIGCENPILRADEFIAKALAAPTYYQLLGVKTLAEFKARAGFERLGEGPEQVAVITNGKLSLNTQQVRRSITLSGYIWEIRNSRNKDFLRELLSNDYDATQIVATNLNGLLTYFAASSNSNSLDYLNADEAIDNSRTVQDYTVRIARNCIFCHAAEGVIPFKDTVRELNGKGVMIQSPNKDEQQKLQDLFATELPFKRDINHYQASLMKATGMESKDFQKAFKGFYKGYYGDLTIKQVAARFGQTEEEFRNFCANSSEAFFLILLLDGKISRARFEALMGDN